jgi:hypothetical protein
MVAATNFSGQQFRKQLLSFTAIWGDTIIAVLTILSSWITPPYKLPPTMARCIENIQTSPFRG